MRIIARSTLATIIALGSLAASTASAGQPVAAPDSQAPDAAANEPLDERSAEGNLLRQMTGEGIRLSEDKRFTLPEPTFVSISGQSVDATTAENAFEQIAGRHGVKRFARDSIVAPISVQTDSIKNAAGKRIGHFIDVAFVVAESIAEIRNSEALDDFKSDPNDEQKPVDFTNQDDPDEFEKNKTRSLTRKELAEHGITLEGKYEALGYLQMPLLSRVVVRGVARARRSVWSSEDENAPILLTWLLDSRFGSDSPEAESISNQWRAIERTDVGEKVLGPPQPYAGMGGYVAITPVPGDPQASIIQLRFVIHEPQAWFNGRNLLRSKLPILIQDRVRNLRRELQQDS